MDSFLSFLDFAVGHQQQRQSVKAVDSSLKLTTKSSRSRSRRSRSRSGSRTIIGVTPKPGGLSKHGYHADNSVKSRHAALIRAARSEGYRPVIARLNLEYVYLKNASPRYARIFKADQRWLSAQYDKVKSRSSSSRSRRSSSTRRRSKSRR